MWLSCCGGPSEQEAAQDGGEGWPAAGGGDGSPAGLLACCAGAAVGASGYPQGWAGVVKNLPGDGAALIRAFLRGDAEAVDVMLPGENDELLLFAFGMAVTMAREAVGGSEALDEALQLVIEAHRGVV